MAKLIFLLDGNVVKEYLLDKERMSIGRRATNDIYVDNLAISGEHAMLVTVDADSYIEDLNSTNGTLVNQKAVKKQTLKHGDEIGLGKYTLKFLSDGVANLPASNGFSDTVLIESESTASKDSDVPDAIEVAPIQASSVADVETEEVEPDQVEAIEQNAAESEPQEPIEERVVLAEDGSAQPITPETTSPGPHLKTLNGELAGSVLLLDRSMVKVGQPGEQVAVVTKRQDSYFITHVAGDHYPLVNGEAIGAQAYALSNLDEVEVMGVKMEFRHD